MGKHRFKGDNSRLSFLVWNSKIHKGKSELGEPRFNLGDITRIMSPSKGILELELKEKGKNLFYLKELRDSEREVLIEFLKPKEIKKAMGKEKKSDKNKMPTKRLTVNAEKGQRVILEIKISGA